MKSIVISASAKLQDKIEYWTKHFKNKGYEVIDYPKQIDLKYYENRHKEFYSNLEKTKIYFLMNETKNNIEGYIGASSAAELNYVIIQNLIHDKKIEIYILNRPSKQVHSYDEVMFWAKLGWVKFYNENEL